MPAIFVESTINPKLLKQVAHDQGIRIGGKLYADSLGDEESGADTYIKMIRHNTKTIVSGLTGSSAGTRFKGHEWLLMMILALAFGATIFLISYLLKGKLAHGADEVLQDKALEVENLTTSYHRNTVISNVNLYISPGKLYGIIGPNLSLIHI